MVHPEVQFPPNFSIKGSEYDSLFESKLCWSMLENCMPHTQDLAPSCA